MHPILKSFREQQRENYNKAERTFNALPEFDWDIHIDVFGDISIKTDDLPEAKEALEKAGARPFTTNKYSFFFADEIIFLHPND